MKGQMFIITMVFLVGLIFAVQNSLSQYSFSDLAQVFEKNDLYLLESIKNSFNETLSSSKSCEELDINLQELEAFLEEKIVAGIIINIDYLLVCDQELTLAIHLKSIGAETTETITFPSGP